MVVHQIYQYIQLYFLHCRFLLAHTLSVCEGITIDAYTVTEVAEEILNAEAQLKTCRSQHIINRSAGWPWIF